MDILKIHPSHHAEMRTTAIVLALLVLGMAAVWLLPPIPEVRGMAGYLPLHLLLETLSIVIAVLIFAVSWNAYSAKLPGNTVLLGCVFFGVALIDFSHTLSFAGMPEFVTESSPEKAINFWLVSRFMAAVALLTVAIAPWRPFVSSLTRFLLFAVVIVVVALTHWVLLFHSEWTPHTFVPGEGLTAFKVYSEYSIILICLVASGVLLGRMRGPQPFNAVALFGAVGTMALSEFLFTLYADVTDIYNLLGHVYKAASYLFIYRAIFVTTVENPYRQLSESQGKLQATLDAIPDLLFELDMDGRFLDYRTPHADRLFVSAEMFLGRTVAEIMPADAAAVVLAALREAKEKGGSWGHQIELQMPQGKQWFELSVAHTVEQPGRLSRFIVLSRDITERKLNELEVRRLSRLYSALSRCNEAIVRSNSVEELLPIICRDVVEFGGMKMAWVGMVDELSREVVSVASFGNGEEAMEGLKAPLRVDEPSMYGPTAIAISQDEPFWCQDFQNDPITAIWHDHGIHFGWGASAALPLHRNGHVVGAFSMYAEERGAFDERARRLLVEMAMDIDFALHNFEREALRKQALAELDESRNLLKTVIDTAPMRIFWKDRELRYLGCNPVFARDAGLNDPQQVIGKDDYQLGWSEQAELYRADDRRVIESGVAKSFYDEPQTTPDGRHIWLSTSKVPLRNAQGETTGVLGIYMDITDRKQAEAALQRSEAELNLAQSIARVGSWNYNLATGRIEGSEEAYRMFGIPPRAVDLDTVMAIVHPDDRELTMSALHTAIAGNGFEVEFRIVVSGDTRWISARARLEYGADGKPATVLGTTQDITEHKYAEDRINYLAHFDVLTGLPNRILLDERINYAISMAKRSNEHIALLFIDLDHFKDINDTLGHSVGDAVLVQLAKRLQQALRDQDVVSRLGGDEFIVMLPDTDARGITLVVQKLLDVVAQPYQIEEYDLNLTASIGIAMYPEDGDQLESLSRSADTAMYRAKQDGRNCFRFFTSEMQARSARNLRLVNDLRQALDRGQLHIVFQPQLSVGGDAIIGAEALLRWQHPELGAVAPAEFIPVAEDSGMILLIGEWVMRQALRQLKSWMADGIEPMIMAVNLSAVQFRHANLPELVSRILEEEDLPPEYLELELTEGVAMNDPQSAIAVMNNLHDRGIRMSIDDFGTGYSSLSYLKKFKVYKLKIDQSFVRDISTDPEDKAIVTTIINIARSLGLRTIAEGVETAGQLAYLREQGCDEVQGYYYSRPLSAVQFATYVKSIKSRK
jgi:diguanylate cyclase (GGDEF)-like protein/PAS domain S-box-containing protein